MNAPNWYSKCELTTKKGEKVPLLKALEELDEIDFTKPAYVFDAYVDHDLLLLCLSSDKYPVVIESMARDMKRSLREKP